MPTTPHSTAEANDALSAAAAHHPAASEATPLSPAAELGDLIWSLLLTRYTEAQARAWVAILTEPLRPADPRRAGQDRALTTLTNRLFKAVDGVAA